MLSLAELTARTTGPGRLDWIGLRPARRADMIPSEAAEIRFEGLVGDHRGTPGKRAVTLIQAEHLPVIAALAGHTVVSYEVLRRNLGIAGINLIGLRGRTLQIGSVTLRITGPCAPCSRMESALGFGGYAAMRGHGGMTAEVVSPGKLAIGASVTLDLLG